MGKVYDTVTHQLAAWIGRQPMFFVATAPSGDDGHVNISPKGPIGTLRILDEKNTVSIDGLPALTSSGSRA